MSTRVPVSAATNVGRMYLQFVARQMEALQMGLRIKKVLDFAQEGGTPDWAAVAAELGLQGETAEADAEAAYGLLVTAMAQIDSPQVQFLARVDQG